MGKNLFFSVWHAVASHVVRHVAHVAPKIARHVLFGDEEAQDEEKQGKI